MQPLGIIGTCVLAAVGYGVIHDQITARVCVEYFTVGHAKIIDSEDPTLLGLVWGVVATWWAGLMLGVPLALAARAGSRPKRSLRSLIRPILFLLALMAGFALVSCIVGYMLASTGTVVLPEPLKEKLPSQKWAAFQACAFAHQMGYNVAFVGGGMIIAWVWVSRKRLTLHKPAPPRVHEGPNGC
jgi:hypothetical protein